MCAEAALLAVTAHIYLSFSVLVFVFVLDSVLDLDSVYVYVFVYVWLRRLAAACGRFPALRAVPLPGVLRALFAGLPVFFDLLTCALFTSFLRARICLSI